MNTTPDKKLTPMAKLIDRIKPLIGKYGIEADAMITTVIQEATSLLPAEREMGESAWDDAYAVGCVVGGNDYTNEQDEDTGFHYFTQNYRQQ